MPGARRPPLQGGPSPAKVEPATLRPGRRLPAGQPRPTPPAAGSRPRRRPEVSGGERCAREGRRRPLVGMDPWEGVLANRKPSFQRTGLLTWRVVFFYDLILYFWIGK